jgi:hypothetical protein
LGPTRSRSRSNSSIEKVFGGIKVLSTDFSRLFLQHKPPEGGAQNFQGGTMKKRRIKILFCLFLILTNSFGQVSFVNAQKTKQTKVSDIDITKGLKEALSIGTSNAIKQLGKENGYLNNLKVKIPMPKHLRGVEKTLRFLRQNKLADDFVAAMNHAAEKAVVEAIDIFVDSIKQMTFEDARQILFGADDAATQFFRRTSEKKLFEKFLPIVRTFTESVGVTANYKKMVEKVPITAITGKEKFDLDEYVTQKALDGLFLVIAEEELKIRKNPVARTTDILRKIFGIKKK